MARVVMTPGYQRRILNDAEPEIHRIRQQYVVLVRRIINVKTGALRQSVKLIGKRVHVDTDHWHFIEYGTSPHRQRHWITGTTFIHPGTPEFAPMRRALHIMSGGSTFTSGSPGFVPNSQR